MNPIMLVVALAGDIALLRVTGIPLEKVIASYRQFTDERIAKGDPKEHAEECFEKGAELLRKAWAVPLPQELEQAFQELGVH